MFDYLDLFELEKLHPTVYFYGTESDYEYFIERVFESVVYVELLSHLLNIPDVLDNNCIQTLIITTPMEGVLYIDGMINTTVKMLVDRDHLEDIIEDLKDEGYQYKISRKYVPDNNEEYVVIDYSL